MRNYKKIGLLLTGSLMMINMADAQLQYPVTKKVDTVDTYFGTKVADPYRWLEDDNSQETKAWVESQNKVTDNYLSQITYREKVKARLTALWNYDKINTLYKKGKLFLIIVKIEKLCRIRFTRSNGVMTSSSIV